MRFRSVSLGIFPLSARTMTKVAIINGPNLNALGQREPQIYGSLSLEEMENEIRSAVGPHIELRFFQSNHEGSLVDEIQLAGDNAQGIVINPAAYSHTSVAIRDALLSIQIPTIEVHLSNIAGREVFRQTSITAGACRGCISGLGWHGYVLAIRAILKIECNA